jgi:uncharacterized protein YjbI with pentapeptide repeats
MVDNIENIAINLQEENNDMIEQNAAIKLAKENAAATTISKRYISKMGIDAKYKSLGGYICSHLGKDIEAYRIQLEEILNSHGDPYHIKNLYLYYCRFNTKILGYYNNTYIIKKLSNTVFINTEFKSTNFIGIHFKTCKFISGKPEKLMAYGMNMLQRKLISTNRISTKDKAVMVFDENTLLSNCLIENCLFDRVRFKKLTYGSVITDIDTGILSRTPEVTRFFQCKFNSPRFDLIAPINTGAHQTNPNTGLTNNNYVMTFNVKYDIQEWANKRKKNIHAITRKKVIVHPIVVFEKSKFKNLQFSNAFNYGQDLTISHVLFIKCSFKYDINDTPRYVMAASVTFDNVEFRDCDFTNTIFSTCTFDKCKFIGCVFSNTFFHHCDLAGTASQMFHCKFKDKTHFFECEFTNIHKLDHTLRFNSLCEFNDVIFEDNNMLNFAFNDDILTIDDNDIKVDNIMKMTNCKFHRNILYGTSFDYCDLEGSNFAARTTGREEINWFGRALISMDEDEFHTVNINLKKYMNSKYPNKQYAAKDVTQVIVRNHYLNTLLLTSDNINAIQHINASGVYVLEKDRYIAAGYPDGAERFILDNNIQPWDYIKNRGDILYFVPATSFEGANIRTCNFQSMGGFEGFDFTQLADGRLPPLYDSPTVNLNAVNFTDVDLTNANFEGANMIGTVFQVATLNGANFDRTITNEHTDFQNTIGIATILNADHINFGVLQNNANETHSRAQLIINNRNKYKEYYHNNIDIAKIGMFYFTKHHKLYHKKLMTYMRQFHPDTKSINLNNLNNYHESFAENIGEGIDTVGIKWVQLTLHELVHNRTNEEGRTKPIPIEPIYTIGRIIKSVLSRPDSAAPLPPVGKENLIGLITIGITNKLKWNEVQLKKLKVDLDIIIDEAFIKIAISKQKALRQGTKGAWCWYDLILESLLFLFSCPAIYINSFFEFYFNEVFNAHGVGSRSCTLGMVERLVTIHSQTAETFIMTMDIKPTPEAVNAIRRYDVVNPDIIDQEITVEYIEHFNKPLYKDAELQMNKYKFNKFINLLKPNSSLPETAEDDIGITMSYDIKSQWREDFMKPAKIKVDSGDIKTLDQLAVFYLEWITERILLDNDITPVKFAEAQKRGGKYFALLDDKVVQLTEFLAKNEIPQFKEAVIMMTSDKVTHDELIEYYEGGGKSIKQSTKRLNKTKSLYKTKTLNKTKSSPIKINKNIVDKLDRLMVKAFIKLPTEKVSVAFKNAFGNMPVYLPRNMSIQDQPYRNILKKKAIKIKRISHILATNKHAIDKYIHNLKKSNSVKTASAKPSRAKGGSRKKFTKKYNRSINKRGGRRSRAALKKATLKRR